MTTIDTTKFLTIYELEWVIAEAYSDKKRFVHVEHIAFYNTVGNAEEAMRAFILEKKKQVGDELYYDGCINYQISERRVYSYPNPDEDVCTEWKSYTPDGVLNQNQMSNS